MGGAIGRSHRWRLAKNGKNTQHARNPADSNADSNGDQQLWLVRGQRSAA